MTSIPTRAANEAPSALVAPLGDRRAGGAMTIAPFLGPALVPPTGGCSASTRRQRL